MVGELSGAGSDEAGAGPEAGTAARRPGMAAGTAAGPWQSLDVPVEAQLAESRTHYRSARTLLWAFLGTLAWQARVVRGADAELAEGDAYVAECSRRMPSSVRGMRPSPRKASSRSSARR